MIPFTRQIRAIFLEDPTSFLDNVAVSVSSLISEPSIRGMPDDLTFRAEETPALRDRNGVQEEIQCYMLTKAKSGEVSFKAYIAEYHQSTTTATILGSAADLCFTANMNGCTFGLGSQATAADTLLVTHGNAAGHAGTTDFRDKVVGKKQEAFTALQTSIQYSEAKSAGVDRVFEPEHYRIDGKQSITFGWRKPGKKWAFYFLSYKRAQGVVTSYGVKPVSTNQVLR